MPKALIWFLMLFGFFFLFVGIFVKFFFVVGLIMLGVGAYFGVGPDSVLRKDQVIDSWAALIENGQTKSDAVLCDTEAFMTNSKVPDIVMERKEISPTVISGFIGKKRDFLTITGQGNFRLNPYKIYINTRDYGDNLDVSWHLTYKPSILQSIASLLPFINIIPLRLNDLDLFDQQDLRAYATNVHHCFLKAVEKLLLTLNQDPSKLERKSRGFLGIS
jgi:hypothetical protein